MPVDHAHCTTGSRLLQYSSQPDSLVWDSELLNHGVQREAVWVLTRRCVKPLWSGLQTTLLCTPGAYPTAVARTRRDTYYTKLLCNTISFKSCRYYCTNNVMKSTENICTTGHSYCLSDRNIANNSQIKHRWRVYRKLFSYCLRPGLKSDSCLGRDCFGPCRIHNFFNKMHVNNG